ncbi:MAG: imidazolonepropionase [Chloroflexota bacterium]|nr:imidazolonepropionase [Chloroflexota bacterium]
MTDGGLLLAGSGRLCVAQPAGADRSGVLSPWAVLVEAGRIAWVGSPDDAPASGTRIDLGSALVTPGLVDAHTHPVYAGDRSDDTAARLSGAPYDGGGILRTVRATRAASDEELSDLLSRRLSAALAAGTTTIEAKSGYGLSLTDEVRALRLLAAADVPIRLVRTFLAAHAVPEGMAADEFVQQVVEEMLPAAGPLADFCDVFCDAGFFSVVQAETVLTAARRRGLELRLHAEQLARTGATELGVRLGAASVDHLEQLDAAGIAALAASSTVATLLPGPAVVLGGGLPPARALLDAGATVAIASDANAGTFGSFSMPLVIGLAATLLGMNVAEAVVAATAGGAASLGLSEVCGAIRAGLAADLVAWDAEHEGAFALRLGDVQPHRIWIGGNEMSARPG